MLSVDAMDISGQQHLDAVCIVKATFSFYVLFKYLYNEYGTNFPIFCRIMI